MLNAADTVTVTGARLIVDALLTHGVDRIFCVPGESFLAVLDSLYDESERIRDGPARHCVRDARPGRDARVNRRAYGVSGFDADDPLHWPMRA
jgi:Thiamine pyrophosphate enzyme, N-terminal TPP binding domain